MNNNPRGVMALLLAVIIWGNFTLVFHYLNQMPALDIVAHRVLWGLIAFLAWMGYKGRFSEIVAVFKDKSEVFKLVFAAIFVAFNWLGFVWASGNGHALEAGFGYFIYPLLTIAIGAIFLGDRPSQTQWIAIALTALAVAILTYGLGKLPFISLLLAVTFSVYGVIKRFTKSGAVLSVSIENILLFPIAVFWLSFGADHQAGFLSSAGYSFWLIMAGLLTALALIGFSFASKTINFATVGMLFFVNPTLQIINGAWIIGEPMTIWHKTAFPLITLACAIYVWDLWKRAEH